MKRTILVLSVCLVIYTTIVFASGIHAAISF